MIQIKRAGNKVPYKFNPKNVGPLLIIVAPIVALIVLGGFVASSWN